MILIRPGAFIMGSPGAEPLGKVDETQHPVVISRAYLLGAGEVTRAQWSAVMGSSPGYFQGCSDCPVESVSWYDAVDFCNALSAAAGLEPAYARQGDRVVWRPEAGGYRLPTEAEWEYACRAGTVTAYHTGACLAADQANYNGYHPLPGCPDGMNRGEPVPVRSLTANAWGLHDMHGNINEWCWDWYGDYPAGSVNDPRGPDTGQVKVHRGGCWANFAAKCRSANRERVDPDARLDMIGLRVARNAQGEDGR
ncbi:MAG: formylglycine-generating enzyme family protein [bacterium]